MPTHSKPAATHILPSHVYELQGSRIVPNVVATFAVILAIGIATQLALRTGAMPGPSFVSDPDSTIIATKATLARASSSAQVAFVGDSSCLTDLDIATIESAGGLDSVNLGTLSYLSLDSFGVLAAEFARGKTTPRVVLAVHPDCLRVGSPSAAHRAILDSALGKGAAATLQTNETLAAVLGFDDVRVRATDRFIPHPLRGAFGGRYGFTVDLRESLILRQGSMDESAVFDPATNHGSAEYRLAPRIQEECRLFRAALPPGTRLRVLVTPVPKSHALKSHETRVREMRAQLETWLGAETPGLDLPLVLPDSDFGTVTHLKPEAAVRYSRLVGERLRDWK